MGADCDAGLSGRAGAVYVRASVAAQGRALGAAYFGRLEGCWYGNDGKIYIVSTTGGGSGRGQIWEYSTRRPKRCAWCSSRLAPTC